MGKVFFYIILTAVSLLLVILDILRPFLGIVRLLGYLNLLMLGFSYAVYDDIHFSLVIGTVMAFSIFYGYQSIMEFLAGVKYGMLESQKTQNQ